MRKQKSYIVIEVFQYLYWLVPLHKWCSPEDIPTGPLTQDLTLGEVYEALRTLLWLQIIEMEKNKVRIKEEINTKFDPNIQEQIIREIREKV